MIKINIKYHICALLVMFVTMAHAQITATITPIQNGQGGSITLDIQGGNAPFTFQWYKTDPVFGQGTYSTEQNIKDLEEGEYCVEITDDKCCTAQQCFEIKKEECNSVFVANKVNPTSCERKSVINTVPPTPTGKNLPGSSDGSVTIGITAPFTEKDFDFTWEIRNPNGVFSFFRKGKNLTNLVSGTYKLKVKNITNGCEQTLFVTLCCCGGSEVSYYDEGGNFLYTNFQSDPLDPKHCFDSKENPLKAESNPTPPSSNTAKDGSISLTAGGGVGAPYYYKWTGPNGFTSTSASISGLSKGEYCYTVTDGCGSVKDCIPMYVCEEKPMVVTAKLEKPCEDLMAKFPGNTKAGGTITATATGGVPAYKYQWSTGAKGPILKNVKSGTYCVTVTDKGGCTVVGCFTLSKGQSIDEKFSLPCKIEYYCESKDRSVFTEYKNTRKEVDKIDCSKLNLICEATGVQTGTEPNPKPNYVSTGPNFAACGIFGVCKSGFVVRLLSGSTYTKTLWNCEQGCQCLDVTYCNLGVEGTMAIKSVKVGLEKRDIGKCQYVAFDGQILTGYLVGYFCGEQLIKKECRQYVSPGEKVSVVANILTDMTIGELFMYQFDRPESGIDENTKIYVAEGIDLNTTITEFQKIMASNSEDQNSIMHPLEFNDYKLRDCDKISYKLEIIDDRNDSSDENDVKANSDFELFPNPTNNFVFIKKNKMVFKNLVVNLYDELGRSIYDSTWNNNDNLKIDVSRFSSGTYFIKVTDENSNIVFQDKIIKISQ